MKIIDLLTNLKTSEKREIIPSPFHENKSFPRCTLSKDSLITIIIFLHRKRSPLISIFVLSLHMYLTLINVLNPDKITKLIRCIFFLLMIYELITGIKKLIDHIKEYRSKDKFDINRTENKIIVLNIINQSFSILSSFMSLIVDFLSINFDTHNGTIEYMDIESSGFSISLSFLQIVTFSFKITQDTTKCSTIESVNNYCGLLFSVVRFTTLIIDMTTGSNLSIYVSIGQLTLSLTNELASLFIETEIDDNDEKNNPTLTTQAREMKTSKETYITYRNNVKPNSELIDSHPEQNLSSKILQPQN